MSYCRFSSDNFSSDICCYAAHGGIQIHVAGNRVVGPVPVLPSMAADPDAFVEAYMAQMAYLRTAKREPIGLAHDGASFSVETEREAAEKLLALRVAGYSVPQYAVETLLSEADCEADLDQFLNQIQVAALEPQEQPQ